MTSTDFFKLARSKRGTAVPCTPEHADYCLGVLPPVYGSDFFGVGEPYSHETAPDGKEVVVRHWCKTRGDLAWCCHGTAAEARAAFAF